MKLYKIFVVYNITILFIGSFIMFINVVKKIGMMLNYYFIGTFFSTALDMFGILPERGIIYALLHALAIGAIICAISRYLRIGKLKKFRR